MWAAELRDHIVLVGQHPEEPLEPAFGASIAAIEGGEGFLDALK
jgi:hypothetical protein